METPARYYVPRRNESLARIARRWGTSTGRLRSLNGLGSKVATVRAVLEHVVVLAEVQTLKGRRFGNLVIAASRAPLPTDWLPRLMAAGPHPAKVAHGAELDEFVRGARPATDADASASPKPAASVFER